MVPLYCALLVLTTTDQIPLTQPVCKLFVGHLFSVPSTSKESTGVYKFSNTDSKHTLWRPVQSNMIQRLSLSFQYKRTCEFFLSWWSLALQWIWWRRIEEPCGYLCSCILSSHHAKQLHWGTMVCAVCPKVVAFESRQTVHLLWVSSRVYTCLLQKKPSNPRCCIADVQNNSKVIKERLNKSKRCFPVIPLSAMKAEELNLWDICLWLHLCIFGCAFPSMFRLLFAGFPVEFSRGTLFFLDARRADIAFGLSFYFCTNKHVTLLCVFVSKKRNCTHNFHRWWLLSVCTSLWDESSTERFAINRDKAARDGCSTSVPFYGGWFIQLERLYGAATILFDRALYYDVFVAATIYCSEAPADKLRLKCAKCLSLQLWWVAPCLPCCADMSWLCHEIQYCLVSSC